MMSTKDERLVVRITTEMKDRLVAYVDTVPGELSDVVRDALERYLDDEESLREIIEAHKNEAQTH